MAGTVRLECSATGYPEPDIEWYRNGEKILTNSVTSVDGGQLRINSVDPKDGGIYQCMAKNEIGQAFSAAFLTVRLSGVASNLPRLYGVKCYPLNYGSVLVTFRSTKPVEMINYYLSADNPSSWEAVPPVKTSEKFIITGKMDPLREYTLHLRGLIETSPDPSQPLKTGQDSMLMMSQLSKGVTCQTQGMELLSTPFPDHVFLWWPTTNHQHINNNIQHQRKNNYTLDVDHYLVQLWNNDTLDNPSLFATEVIGTIGELDEYQTWNEIEKQLVKIPSEASLINSTFVTGSAETFVQSSKEVGSKKKHQIRTRTHFNVMQVKLNGNVTGILIPNTKKVLARVIGVKDGHVVLDQDLRYVQWKKVSEN